MRINRLLRALAALSGLVAAVTVAVMAAGIAAGLILGGIGNILFLRSMIQVRREQQRKERGQ